MGNEAKGSSGAKGGSGGVKTDFQSMSHDDLWAWLTPSSSWTVQDVSDRLSEASTALEKLAADLTKHMKDVHWQGEAGTAFTNWGTDTANSTKRLADYSRDSAKWLSLAATAITEAHSAMPDSLGSAQANADAARKYHNDPDSVPMGSSARATINKFQPPPDENGKVSPEALAAASVARENARQEAIQNMRKLAGQYGESASQMNGLPVPTFPAPPDRFVPRAPAVGRSADSQSIGTQSRDQVGRTSSADDRVHSTTSDTPESGTPAEKHGQVRPERPTNLGIDSVDTLPPQTQLPPTTNNPLPPVNRHEAPNIVPPATIPPTFGSSKSVPPISGMGGKTLPNARSVMPPGQPGLTSKFPREGISGGRPVPPNTGRPNVGIPRGTVIGQEGTTNNTRGPMGRSMPSMHGGGHMGPGQNGISGGRRLASEVGGIVGGRPQQPGQSSARPFTPGGSGLVRGASPTSADGTHSGQAGRAGAVPPGTHGSNRRDDQNGSRPDYLSEDEETWQQGSRPVVPPVID